MAESNAILSERNEGGGCIVEGSVKDLSKYRFESAKDDLDSAGMLLRDGK